MVFLILIALAQLVVTTLLLMIVAAEATQRATERLGAAQAVQRIQRDTVQGLFRAAAQTPEEAIDGRSVDAASS